MYTRCSNCRTTFRITADALERAGGQVRCGRCTHVFDATAELADELPVPNRNTDTGPQTAADAGSALRPPPPTSGGRSTRAAAPSGSTDPGAAPATAETAADGPVFLFEERPAAARGRSRRQRLAWGVAAVLAAVVLAGQLAHHFRASLVQHGVVGAYVAAAYDTLGIEVVPRRDPGRYRIRDWVATAEQNPGGRSSLLIRAEIENRGPEPMPQPHIHLALKDRWDAVVASRVFAPGEYLRRSRADESMDAGTATVAELEVVDPGPDAYGFELDVCVPRGGGGVRCANDDVFR